MAFFRHTIILALLLWICLFFWGSVFDKECIEGRLSASQVAVINSLEWDLCPGYRKGYCRAEEGDRVLVRECSNLSRRILLRNPAKELRKKIGELM